ncbi:MAG: DUF91 domain-containing protein [Planctomycetes bacterium]|nr:DUF91 domain-containing protein [Planctomycetota bacterium]
MRKPHNVVLQKPDGGLEIHAMKKWLRDNPDCLPEGMDPDENTSHELRQALFNIGWGLKIRDDQVLLIKPAEDGGTSINDDNIPIEKPDDEDEEDIETEEITFGLERDLQLALRANIQQLEAGLKIIDGGKERVTEAGRIDITAADIKDNVVIIELKAGTASPQVIAQVLAYMGAIYETDKKPVRGILVAGDFHKRVILAARAIPNLELRKYSIKFAFEPVE